jgi:hypothetical protein
LDASVWTCNGEAFFEFTGGPQTFAVPAGVTQISIYAAGAEGGFGGEYGTSGGLGGLVEADIDVTPGETLEIYVGGEGRSLSGTVIGCWNGGGCAGAGGGISGTGGGATDIRRSPFSLDDRVVVAGGGGAGGSTVAGSGGVGGGLVGGTGTSDMADYLPALGGPQDAGGAQGYAIGWADG